MKSLLILGLMVAGSASAAHVCKMKHDTRSGSSHYVLHCGGEKPREVTKSEYAKPKVKLNHLQKKLAVIEELVEKGYTVVSESLFVKY